MTGTNPIDISLHCKAGNVLGEGPLWDPESASLLWVDIPRNRVMCLVEGRDEPSVLELPEPAGSLGRLAGGGYLAASGRSLYRISFEPIACERLVGVDAMDPSSMLNDGHADRVGRFVVGSKHTGETEPKGAMFSFGHGAGPRELHAPFIVFNGPAFSLGGDRIYFADSLKGRISCAPYDTATGRMGEPETFARIPSGHGYPDGMAVDAEDCLWNCHWEGARLTRYRPDGSVDRVVEVPLRRPTSLCFGGADLKTVFVTSAGLGEEVPGDDGDGISDGDVVRFRADVPGLVEPAVRLSARG